MPPSPLDITNLISHRFRGFSEFENTLDGLQSALDFGVQNLEFDVRVAACGTPMVYHDEYALDAQGVHRKLCDYKASQYMTLGGAFSRMPTFDALLALINNHNNTTASLLVDIKDYGFEIEIHALIMAYRLNTRTVFVSWLPDVLYRLHEMASEIPLCLSHWCGPVGRVVREKHKVYSSKGGNIKRSTQNYTIGVRSGWSVLKPITGKMLSILSGICVPQIMLTRELSDYYHAEGLFVSTFSYTDWAAIKAHRSTLNIDLYFIDNKEVFEAIQTQGRGQG